MLNGIMSVLVVFVILAVGFYFTYKKMWPENTGSTFSLVVVKIAAPALAIVSIAERFTPELLHKAFFHLLLIFFHTILLYFIGKMLSHFFSMSKKKKAVFQTMFTFSNTIFIGLPINEIVFGQDGLPYLFTYYLVTLGLFWSMGAYSISKVSSQGEGKFSLRKIFSPGLVGVLIGCLLVELQWPLPLVFYSSLKYLGALCVPLSLLVIGSNLVIFSGGIPKITKDEWLIVIGKFIISPILMILLLKITHVSGMAMQVFVLTAAMPCHAQSAILSEFYDVEKEYSAKLVGLTTLFSIIAIPAWVGILSLL